MILSMAVTDSIIIKLKNNKSSQACTPLFSFVSRYVLKIRADKLGNVSGDKINHNRYEHFNLIVTIMGQCI